MPQTSLQTFVVRRFLETTCTISQKALFLALSSVMQNLAAWSCTVTHPAGCSALHRDDFKLEHILQSRLGKKKKKIKGGIEKLPDQSVIFAFIFMLLLFFSYLSAVIFCKPEMFTWGQTRYIRTWNHYSSKKFRDKFKAWNSLPAWWIHVQAWDKPGYIRYWSITCPKWLPLSSVQRRESPTLLDFSWVNIPRWGQRSCVHTGHSAHSARGPRSRHKNGCSNQARVHVGTAVRPPPSAETIKLQGVDTTSAQDVVHPHLLIRCKRAGMFHKTLARPRRK